MVKTKIVETTEKYDKDGKLAEKITREETSEDNTNYSSDCVMHINYEEIPKIPCKAAREACLFRFAFKAGSIYG